MVNTKSKFDGIMIKQEEKLKDLIIICEDAREFYTDIIEQTHNSNLRKFFRSLADVRKSIIVDIRTFMRKKNMTIIKTSDIVKKSDNLFLDNIGTINNIDSAFIKQIEASENKCLHLFKNIANDNQMPDEIREFVSSKFEALNQAQEIIESLKYVVKSA